MENRRYIPIKYKFLAVLFSITVMSLGVFFAFTYKTFSEDKKLFVMDLNISVLRATTSEIKLELKGRVEELQILVPRVYQRGQSVLTSKSDKSSEDPFQGLSPSLSDELLRISFYKKTADNGFKLFKEYENTDLVEKKKLPDTVIGKLKDPSSLNLTAQLESQDMGLVNRSVEYSSQGRTLDLPVITFLVSGNYVDSDSQGVVIAIDMIQDFLRKKLQQSEIAEIFLLKKGGNILSHPSSRITSEYANSSYPHPIVERIAGKQFPRESMELDINGEFYLCNVSETGFRDIYAVSQIRRSEAFLALQTLIRKSAYLSVLVLAIAMVLSIVFAAGLTSNIQKLQQAAELIGAGNLKVNIQVKSRDEIGLVSESFQWMAGRVEELLTETAQKARMAEELETARLVQSTLLTTPTFDSQSFEVDSYYTAASECGGDFWDAFVKDKTLTLIVGDATGHGTPAAMVTAVAKACFATINAIFKGDPLPPERVLEMANHVIYTACKGKLLMTMCLIQLDLETGKIVFCSAGHEPAFCMRKAVKTEEKPAEKRVKISAEVLFARGERLGFARNAKYVAEEFQLNLGDTIMVYTDGLSEAHSPEQAQWGDRALKKAFTKLGSADLAAIKSNILGGLSSHIGNEPYHDDVTFVLLRWLKSSTQEKSTHGELPAFFEVPAPVVTASYAEKTPEECAVPSNAGATSVDSTAPHAPPEADNPASILPDDLGDGALHTLDISTEPTDLTNASELLAVEPPVAMEGSDLPPLALEPSADSLAPELILEEVNLPENISDKVDGNTVPTQVEKQLDPYVENTEDLISNGLEFDADNETVAQGEKKKVA